MRVGDGNVEVRRQLALLYLNVCWSPPLGGEGGELSTEFLIGKGAQRAVETWGEDGTGREVWEKWRRGVWSGVVEAGEEWKRGVLEHSPFVVG